jgi:hypothetical protein
VVSFTFTEWIILALVLVLGWVLGLMSRSGGTKWRRQLDAERRAHEDYRRDSDARYAELERSRAAHRDTVHRDGDVRHDSAIDNLDLRNRRP